MNLCINRGHIQTDIYRLFWSGFVCCFHVSLRIRATSTIIPAILTPLTARRTKKAPVHMFRTAGTRAPIIEPCLPWWLMDKFTFDSGVDTTILSYCLLGRRLSGRGKVGQVCGIHKGWQWMRLIFSFSAGL